VTNNKKRTIRQEKSAPTFRNKIFPSSSGSKRTKIKQPTLLFSFLVVVYLAYSSARKIKTLGCSAKFHELPPDYTASRPQKIVLLIIISLTTSNPNYPFLKIPLRKEGQNCPCA
jgi:hypothetical protein